MGSSPTDSTKKNYCVDCGKEINFGSLRCEQCNYIASRIVERPSREELKKMIRSLSFTKIAELYKVSDNAIRKWCDSYKLPRKKKEINKYSDNDWANI